MSEFVVPDWISDHLDLYQSTDGKEGHIWQGVTTLLLKTTGRKSGAERLMPLIYGGVELEDGHSGFVIIASKGGHAAHPAWYLNLQAQPQVKIQVATDKYLATASTVEDQRRADYWQLMTTIWPDYEKYQAATDRHIPVVLLTPDQKIDQI